MSCTRKKLRVHCTTVRSDNHSEDLIPVPNNCSTAGYCWLWNGGLCDPTLICLPRPSVTHHQTDHAGWCYRQDIVHHGFSRFFHAYHIYGQCEPALICDENRAPVADLLILVFSANANWAARYWAVSTGHTRGLQALMPPSWKRFLTIWSETCTPVTCWRLFCRALAVLLIAQRSSSCCWVDAFYCSVKLTLWNGWSPDISSML